MIKPIIFTFIGNDPIPFGIIEVNNFEFDVMKTSKEWPPFLRRRFINTVGYIPCYVSYAIGEK